MSWVKLDDRYFDNPKIAALSDAAKVAHLESMTYCARELTDGHVPLNKAKALAGKPRIVQELVPHLWEPAANGFMVHDYLKYNPTREQVLRERESAKRRMFGRRSGEQTGEQQGEIHPTPVSPIPEGDLSKSPSYPQIPVPTPRFPSPKLPARVVVVGFEQCFGRLLSPMELEQVRALEDEHPPDRIEYALREAAALNKRSVRYVQRTCERIERDGESSANGGGESAAPKDTGGVADRVPGLDRRRAAIAERRRNSEQAEAGLRPVGA
jgi:DnaD/phage-associated family protein